MAFSDDFAAAITDGQTKEQQGQKLGALFKRNDITLEQMLQICNHEKFGLISTIYEKLKSVKRTSIEGFHAVADAITRNPHTTGFQLESLAANYPKVAQRLKIFAHPNGDEVTLHVTVKDWIIQQADTPPALLQRMFLHVNDWDSYPSPNAIESALKNHSLPATKDKKFRALIDAILDSEFSTADHLALILRHGTANDIFSVFRHPKAKWLISQLRDACNVRKSPDATKIINAALLANVIQWADALSFAPLKMIPRMIKTSGTHHFRDDYVDSIRGVLSETKQNEPKRFKLIKKEMKQAKSLGNYYKGTLLPHLESKKEMQDFLKNDCKQLPGLFLYDDIRMIIDPAKPSYHPENAELLTEHLAQPQRWRDNEEYKDHFVMDELMTHATDKWIIPLLPIALTKNKSSSLSSFVKRCDKLKHNQPLIHQIYDKLIDIATKHNINTLILQSTFLSSIDHARALSLTQTLCPLSENGRRSMQKDIRSYGNLYTHFNAMLKVAEERDATLHHGKFDHTAELVEAIAKFTHSNSIFVNYSLLNGSQKNSLVIKYAGIERLNTLYPTTETFNDAPAKYIAVFLHLAARNQRPKINFLIDQLQNNGHFLARVPEIAMYLDTRTRDDTGQTALEYLLRKNSVSAENIEAAAVLAMSKGDNARAQAITDIAAEHIVRRDSATSLATIRTNLLHNSHYKQVYGLYPYYYRAKLRQDTSYVAALLKRDLPPTIGDQEKSTYLSGSETKMPYPLIAASMQQLPPLQNRLLASVASIQRLQQHGMDDIQIAVFTHIKELRALQQVAHGGRNDTIAEQGVINNTNIAGIILGYFTNRHNRELVTSTWVNAIRKPRSIEAQLRLKRDRDENGQHEQPQITAAQR